MTTPHMTPDHIVTTYQDVSPTVRVEVIDDTERGVISYRLQSKVFSQWYYKHEIIEFYDVPNTTIEA